jgi:hypothetical protein
MVGLACSGHDEPRDDVTASRAARERKAGVEAGPLARVRIETDAQEKFVYKVTCTVCTTKRDRPWSAYRPGEDNGYMAAMDRWILHLVERHPDAEAPCLAYLPAAQERLHARRG